jgi:hypothetical protein
MHTISLFFLAISICGCAHATTKTSTASPALVASAPVSEPLVALGPIAPNHDAPFDRGAAAGALGDAKRNLAVCWHPDDPPASGHAQVTFASDGQVSSVDIDQPPFQNDPSRICIAAIFFRAKVPAFAGSPVAVGISFTRGEGSLNFSPTEENALKQAVSAINFSACNPRDEMPPGFYQVTIEFASDGSIARASVSLDGVKQTDCLVEELKKNVHASSSPKPARWLETTIRVPLSTFHVSVSP